MNKVNPTHREVLYVGPSLLNKEFLTIEEETLREYQLREEVIRENHRRESRIALNEYKEKLKKIIEKEKIKLETKTNEELMKEIEYVKCKKWLSRCEIDDEKTEFEETLSKSIEDFNLKSKREINETVILQQKITQKILERKYEEYSNEINEIARKWNDELALEKKRITAMQTTERQQRIASVSKELNDIKKNYDDEMHRRIQKHNIELDAEIAVLRKIYEAEKANTKPFTNKLKDLELKIQHAEDTTKQIYDSYHTFIIYNLNMSEDDAMKLLHQKIQVNTNKNK